jgi:hypothetical protein
MKITDPSFSGTSVLSGSLNVSGSINLNGQALTVSLVPIYGNTSPTVLNSTASIQTLTVTGENFDGTAIGYVKGNNGIRYNPTTSIRNSDVQVTLNFSGSDRLTSANEPYDIYIQNGNGENTFEENVVNVDASPVWQTPAGKIGEVYIGNSLTASFNISATDPDSNDTVSYFITGGALPTGMTFISSSGEISQSGEIVEQVSDTYSSSGVNYNTTFAATDSTSNVLRTFYITKKWRDGSSEASAAQYGSEITTLLGNGFTPGRYWITGLSSAGLAAQQVYVNSDGWMLFYRHAGTGGIYNSTYEIKGDTLGEAAVGTPVSPTMGLTDTGASTTAGSRGVGRFSTEFTRALGGNSASNNVIWMTCGSNTVYITDAQWWSTAATGMALIPPDGYGQTSLSFGATYAGRRTYTNFTGDATRPMSTYPGAIAAIPWYDGNSYSGGYDGNWHVATTIYIRQY